MIILSNSGNKTCDFPLVEKTRTDTQRNFLSRCVSSVRNTASKLFHSMVQKEPTASNIYYNNFSSAKGNPHPTAPPENLLFWDQNAKYCENQKNNLYPDLSDFQQESNPLLATKGDINKSENGFSVKNTENEEHSYTITDLVNISLKIDGRKKQHEETNKNITNSLLKPGHTNPKKELRIRSRYINDIKKQNEEIEEYKREYNKIFQCFVKEQEKFGIKSKEAAKFISAAIKSTKRATQDKESHC